MIRHFEGDFKNRLALASQSREFAVYQEVRDAILPMLNHHNAGASALWTDALEDSLYLLDASPLMVEKWQHFNFHTTGLRSDLYNTHHAYASGPLRKKLEALKALDPVGLLVPESERLGGFGYSIDGKLYNLDTLKFYEVLIGMNQAEFLQPLEEGGVMLEIGAGWGGFAYQCKTLFPRISYCVVDFPQTLLLSATYLKILFPQAKVYIGEGENVRFSDYDFIFIPHYRWSGLAPQHVDLAVNMVSFQEMTDDQVRRYVGQLAEWRCPHFYSLHRDRSPMNKENSGVTASIGRFYDIEEFQVMPVPYHNLHLPNPSPLKSLKNVAKRLMRHQSILMPREYRHLRAILPSQ